MFATKQDLSKKWFRSKQPKQEVYDHLQNQKSKITAYRGNIPDRKLTVKRGVFPHAIHVNPVSKQEIFKKDQHKADPIAEDSNVFQKPKNTFNLFDKKDLNEIPFFGNQTRPSTSTGFFKTTPQHPKTPENSKNPQNDDVTLSCSSDTTAKNKKVLLNKYLTEQYNTVLEAKAASTVTPKHINFNAEEAFQICAYNKIGEVMNQSFIEKSFEFKCTLGMTSSIQKDLRKLHSDRKEKEKQLKEARHSSRQADNEVPKNATNENESTHEQTRSNENFQAASNHELPEEKHAENEAKSNIKNSNFRLKDSVLNTDTLLHWKGNNILNQPNEEIDKLYRRSPNLCNIPEKNPRNNLTTPPPPGNTHNFIREYENRKNESFENKLAECDKIYKKSPLFPIKPENFLTDDHLKPEFKPVNSPTLFFSDTNSSVTPAVKKNDTQMPSGKNFSLDSAVFKRKFSPEVNPIDMLDGTRAKLRKAKKKTSRRKRIITPDFPRSNLSCEKMNRFKRSKKSNEFHLKHDTYSKFDIKDEKYNLF